MSWNASCKCPGSVSPHALRRGYVTAARNAGQPKDVTGERVNRGRKVLDRIMIKEVVRRKLKDGEITYKTYRISY